MSFLLISSDIVLSCCSLRVNIKDAGRVYPPTHINHKKYLFQHPSPFFNTYKYPGVAQLIERVIWDHEPVGLSPATRTIRGYPERNATKSASLRWR